MKLHDKCVLLVLEIFLYDIHDYYIVSCMSNDLIEEIYCNT